MYSGGSIQTTRAGVQLNCLGTEKFRDWLDIRVCNDAVKMVPTLCFEIPYYPIMALSFRSYLRSALGIRT